MNNDLISREALKKTLEELTKDKFDSLYGDGIRRAIREIDNAPTVEPEITEKQAILTIINSGWLVKHDKELREKYERPQGEWAEFEGGYRCSNCDDVEVYTPNFCPNCGAKMKGGAEE